MKLLSGSKAHIQVYCIIFNAVSGILSPSTAIPIRNDHFRLLTLLQILFEKIDGFNAEAVRVAFRVPEEYLKQLKFSECLPQPYATEIVKDRLLQPACLETLLRKDCKFVVVAKDGQP